MFIVLWSVGFSNSWFVGCSSVGFSIFWIPPSGLSEPPCRALGARKRWFEGLKNEQKINIFDISTQNTKKKKLGSIFYVQIHIGKHIYTPYNGLVQKKSQFYKKIAKSSFFNDFLKVFDQFSSIFREIIELQQGGREV